MKILPEIRGLVFLLALPLGIAGCDGDGDGGSDAGGGTDAGSTTMDAGGPADAGPPDAGWEPVTLYTELTDLSDDELADQAVAIMIGTPTMQRCTTCHGLTPDRVREWGTYTTSALDCIGTLEPNIQADALQIMECFNDMTTGMAVPRQLGLVATATDLAWFRRAFDVAYEDEASTRRGTFQMTGWMPRPPGVPLTQDEVDVLLTWAGRGLPGVDERLVIPGAPDCEFRIQPEVNAHIATMQTEGWAARNRDAGITMHGCAAGETGAQCLSTYPLSTTMTYADGWNEVGNLRILQDYTSQSSYWTRSSPDGRFVAMGAGPSGGSGTIIDLARGTDGFPIRVNALYDPGFFPDNSGFAFQGGSGVRFCRESILFGNPSQISFGEPECQALGSAVGLYQHMARIADGDYWTVGRGQFVNDDGGHSPRTTFLPVQFDMRSQMHLVPLADGGNSYTPLPEITVSIPVEGDTVMSPSGRLLMSRVRGMGGVNAGYTLRAMNPTMSGGGYTAETPQIGRYCVRGGKVSFSYDERYVVYHAYVIDEDAASLGYIGTADPNFAPYRSQGASNVFLLDLFSGVSRRITRMNPGQYALFPHFRSDGWIYFQVRANVAEGSTREFIVASDAAIAGSM
ncbi:MAG: hypothetical protein AB7S26_13075 [Sandaracinaceae bacterium]